MDFDHLLEWLYWQTCAAVYAGLDSATLLPDRFWYHK